MWPENDDEEPADELMVHGHFPSRVAPPVDDSSALEIFDLFEISDEIRSAYFALKQ